MFQLWNDRTNDDRIGPATKVRNSSRLGPSSAYPQIHSDRLAFCNVCKRFTCFVDLLGAMGYWRLASSSEISLCASCIACSIVLPSAIAALNSRVSVDSIVPYSAGAGTSTPLSAAS